MNPDLLPWGRPGFFERPGRAMLLWYALDNFDTAHQPNVRGSFIAALRITQLVTDEYARAEYPNGVTADAMWAWWEEKLQAMEN